MIVEVPAPTMVSDLPETTATLGLELAKTQIPVEGDAGEMSGIELTDPDLIW